MNKENLQFIDKELPALIRRSNEKAFQHLFDKHWNDLYKIAYNRFSSHEDVKDLLPKGTYHSATRRRASVSKVLEFLKQPEFNLN